MESSFLTLYMCENHISGIYTFANVLPFVCMHVYTFHSPPILQWLLVSCTCTCTLIMYPLVCAYMYVYMCYHSTAPQSSSGSGQSTETGEGDTAQHGGQLLTFESQLFSKFSHCQMILVCVEWGRHGTVDRCALLQLLCLCE